MIDIDVDVKEIKNKIVSINLTINTNENIVEKEELVNQIMNGIVPNVLRKTIKGLEGDIDNDTEVNIILK